MALFRSKQAAMREPPATLCSGTEVATVISDFVVPDGLAANDIIEMCAQPSDSIPVGATLLCEDTDSNGTPTISLDVAYMAGDYLTDTGRSITTTDFLAASTIARAGGMASSTAHATMLADANVSPKAIGIKVAAAAATLVVGAKWRLVMSFAPKPRGLASV